VNDTLARFFKTLMLGVVGMDQVGEKVLWRSRYFLKSFLRWQVLLGTAGEDEEDE